MIESLTKAHPWFFGNHIDVQKTVRIVIRGLFVHTFELFSGYRVRKSTVYLIQLCFIAGLENQVLCRIETDRSRDTYLTLYEKTNSQRDMSMLDTEMIQHASSGLSVHTTPLTIVANQHVSFRMHLLEWRVVIMF